MLKLDKIYNMDCLDGLQQIDSNSIDLVVTDPPYGLSFMDKDWDKAVPPVSIWRECLRVLKHGSFAFVMCIPRQDCLYYMVRNLGMAGFDNGFTSIYWAFASGFPKSANISKKVDQRFGAEREVIGKVNSGLHHRANVNNFSKWDVDHDKDGCDLTIPSTPQAKALDGSYAGYQPKPAVEIILVAMKPLSEKSYVDQALKNGKGVTWLDSCSVPYGKETDNRIGTDVLAGGSKGCLFGEYSNVKDKNIEMYKDKGRFPANLLVSDDVLNDGKITKSGVSKTKHDEYGGVSNTGFLRGESSPFNQHDDSGSFSRYFSLDAWFEERIKQLPVDVQKVFPFLIVPKASSGEKNKGLGGFEKKEAYNLGHKENPGRKAPKRSLPRANLHPTCKPIDLMGYLIILGSRENDAVLDPFIGSGTTGLAARMFNRHFIGFEISEEYCKIADARLKSIPVSLDCFGGD